MPFHWEAKLAQSGSFVVTSGHAVGRPSVRAGCHAERAPFTQPLFSLSAAESSTLMQVRLYLPRWSLSSPLSAADLHILRLAVRARPVLHALLSKFKKTNVQFGPATSAYSFSAPAVMGQATSSLRGLAANEHLQRLASPEHLPKAHPFWNALLSFNVKTPRSR